ncbi:unnamed protein product [Lampetra planeri]
MTKRGIERATGETESKKDKTGRRLKTFLFPTADDDRNCIFRRRRLCGGEGWQIPRRSAKLPNVAGLQGGREV